MQEDLSTLVDEYCITKQDLIFSDSGYREEMGWEEDEVNNLRAA